MRKNRIFYIFIVLFSVMLFNCKTLPSQQKDIKLQYNKKLSNLGTEEENYIFIRLYYPYYNNPVSIVNILKNLIIWIDVNQIKYSHVAIGFDLNDNFIGLTTPGKQDLKYEHCTNISTNKYMSKCNPQKSQQATYAIKVSKEEYERAKQLTEFFMYEKTIYNVAQNVPVGFFELKRKFFTEQEKQQLQDINSQKDKKNKDEVPLEFVCSNFVAYILINSVDSIKVFFEENNLDYKYIIPSDIPYFPGVTKLFSSSWDNYTKAALTYVKSENNFFAQKKLPNKN